MNRRGEEPEAVDITELLAPGTSLIRHKTGKPPEAFSITGIEPPEYEGDKFIDSHHIHLVRGDGGNSNIRLDDVMGPPNAKGESWQLVVPAV
jgi:hypothetical protein